MKTALSEVIIPVIKRLPDRQLQNSLIEGFKEANEAVSKIEEFFTLLPQYSWSQSFLAQLFNSWKATHLKMLAIYGLSCRLQRLALEDTCSSSSREKFLLAGAFNAETSYEDLGLDYGGQTHAQLYEQFAYSFLKDYPWQLNKKYCLPQAKEFQQWIYHNMVVNDIPIGLFTNMFSEIYNHGEYTLALSAFSELIDNHYSFDAPQKEQALTYIHAHVADETEVDHFLVVIEALDAYCQATNETIDYQEVQNLFTEYLTRLGTVMANFIQIMKQEIDESSLLPQAS